MIQRSVLFAGCLLTAMVATAATPPVALVPGVSEVKWGTPIKVQGAGVIVLADQAGPPEKNAARMLSEYIERRFGEKWSTQTAGSIPAAARLRVYLGQTSTFPELNRLCKEQSLAVPEQADGYALKVWVDGDSVTAVVAGTNARGVIYGQDTLFQLFAGKQGALTVQAATIRDWPTIPQRGRPHPHYQYFFKKHNFDCMMTSRINFIDLRDSIYAFEPGAKLNREELTGVIKDARDHGLRVFTAVNCGVPAAEQDAVLATFKEFLDMGADALWLSFDDKGSGEKPVEMVTRALALAREYGITGDAIGITPPKGDYQTIDRPFNRTIVAVPGMEQALWYWTSIPGAEDAASGEAIGLRVRPSWWHNWPRFLNPALHSGSGSYMPVFSMADGWNHPNERELREMGPYVHAVLPWDGWQAQQHYLVPTIGWFCWRPEQHDLQAARRRIYDMVFGPNQVETALAFDDTLDRVKKRFQYWSTQTDYAPQCPPRLLKLSDRSEIQAKLQELSKQLEKLRGAAGSLLSRELLDAEYCNPMAREIQAGLAQAQAPYPEYWWQSHQDAVSRAIYAGDMAKADQLIASTRDRVLKDISEVQRLLAGEGNLAPYVAWWRARAGATAVEWQQLLAKRQTDLQARIAEYSKTVAPTEQMLAGLADPPIQVGTGAWERHNTLLATVVPEPHETFWGDWIGGIHEHEGSKVVAFALEKHLRVNSNTFSELPVNIPVSGRRDRLALIIYVADANKESFGLGRAKWRWSGYRSLRLLWGEKELWKADLGIPRLTGEWFVVRLPELPADLATLPLRLRLEDYFSAKNNLEIVYVGPIRLLELDGD